jgi:hypothetical protein
MPHWLIKAALQRGISFLPRSHKWNELFQKHVTKSIELTPNRFEERLGFCQRHFEVFTAGRWKYLNNPLTWQNRLRISDYRELFREGGFEIKKEESVSGSAEDLARVRLAPEFKKYQPADLLILTSWLAAKSIRSNV